MAASDVCNIPDVLEKCFISQSQFEESIAELAVSISDTIPCGSRLFQCLKIIMFEKVPGYSFCDDIKYVELINHDFVGARLLQLSSNMLETDISDDVFGILLDIISEITRKNW